MTTLLAPYTGEVCLECGALLTLADYRSSSPLRCAECRREMDREFLNLSILTALRNSQAVNDTLAAAGNTLDTLSSRQSRESGLGLSSEEPGIGAGVIQNVIDGNGAVAAGNRDSRERPAQFEAARSSNHNISTKGGDASPEKPANLT